MASVKKITDPLTFLPLRKDSVVQLKSDSGAIFKYQVSEINEDGSLLLERVERSGSKLESSYREIVISHHAVLGGFGVRQGDKIKITYKDGKSEIFQIDLIVDKGGILVVSPPSRKRPLSMIDKLRFLWRAKGL